MTQASSWTPDQPIIAIADVVKSFGDNQVLKGVSMSVMKGEAVCIIGPSGSGKSTLLRTINALVPIDGGSVRVEGQEVHDPDLDKLKLRRKVGIRITSYNVCYTKLLRFRRVRGRRRSARAVPGRRRGRRGSHAPRRVITSYSIHYTKLYETSSPRNMATLIFSTAFMEFPE